MGKIKFTYDKENPTADTIKILVVGEDQEDVTVLSLLQQIIDPIKKVVGKELTISTEVISPTEINVKTQPGKCEKLIQLIIRFIHFLHLAIEKGVDVNNEGGLKELMNEIAGKPYKEICSELDLLIEDD
jgi:hypothetical protein